MLTVALSGDGADRVFGGYRRHRAELRMRMPGLIERLFHACTALGRSATLQEQRAQRSDTTAASLRRSHSSGCSGPVVGIGRFEQTAWLRTSRQKTTG
ncbi:MAG: hypothetical protein IPO17_12785 [Flavobacteriales bacterium]|nr:hypothetical protein [Flavobacteriales bacterium]